MNRMATEEEVARVSLFLALDDVGRNDRSDDQRRLRQHNELARIRAATARCRSARDVAVADGASMPALAEALA